MVVLVLAVCELGLRIFERRSSVHLTAPAISKQLAAGEGQRVLVFGNSLVESNVNPNVLIEEMRALDAAPVHVERIYLLNTRINDWYYAFKHHFVDAGQTPDVLVLCFSQDHLEDSALQRSIVARYYSSVRDIPEMFSDDVQNFDGRVEFLLSKWSAAFTYRASVHRRVLGLFIPHYYESAERINKNAFRVSGDGSPKVTEPTYHRLDKFLRMAANNGTHVILVAVPMQSPYEIDPLIQNTSKAAGAVLLDTRLVEGLNEDSFVDEMHMNTSGATRYSRSLAHQLVNYLKPTSASEPRDIR